VIGSGLDRIDGLTAGDPVTAEQMRALFGCGLHPLAELRQQQLEGLDLTLRDFQNTARLGIPFRVIDSDVGPFRLEVAKRIGAINSAAGLPVAHRCLLPIGRACGPLSPPLGNRGGSGRLGPFEPPGTQGAHAARSSPNDSLQIRRWFSVSHLVRMLLLDGGAKGTRTPDLLVANETRYRLRHSPATGWADQHRDFTTVTRKQTSAFPRQRSRSRSPTPRPEHPQ
jgi:hypothetical protein